MINIQSKFNFLNFKFLLILFLAGAVFINYFKTKDYPTVKIGNIKFKVEIAETNEEKARGLSGHKELLGNEGMLFVFEKGSADSFWMKGMTFPIDIIWIKDNKISYIVYDAPVPKKEDYVLGLATYQPLEPTDFVLEINAGLSKKYNIKIGDKVSINF